MKLGDIREHATLIVGVFGMFVLAAIGTFATLWQQNFFQSGILNYSFREPHCTYDNETTGDRHCTTSFEIFNDGNATEEDVRAIVHWLPVESLRSDRPFKKSKSGEFTIVEFGPLPPKASFFVHFYYQDVLAEFSTFVKIESKGRLATNIPRPPPEPITVLYGDDRIMIIEAPKPKPFTLTEILLGLLAFGILTTSWYKFLSWGITGSLAARLSIRRSFEM